MEGAVIHSLDTVRVITTSCLVNLFFDGSKMIDVQIFITAWLAQAVQPSEVHPVPTPVRSTVEPPVLQEPETPCTLVTETPPVSEVKPTVPDPKPVGAREPAAPSAAAAEAEEPEVPLAPGMTKRKAMGVVKLG